MTCEFARQLVDAYVDHELEASRKAEFEKHLSVCLGCQAALESRQQLSLAIRSAATYVSAPLSLVARFQRRSRATRARRVGFLSVAVACGLGLLIRFGIPHQPSAPHPTYPEKELLTDMGKALSVNDAPGMTSTNPITVRAWFRGKTDLLPNVPELSSAGFPLYGGKLSTLANKPVPTLVYRQGDQVVEVLIAISGDLPLVNTSQPGLYVRSWDDCGLSYWAVSRSKPSTLEGLKHAFLHPSLGPPVKASPPLRSHNDGRL